MMKLKIDATKNMNNYIDILSKYNLEIIESFDKNSVAYKFNKEKYEKTYFITLKSLKQLFDLSNELGKELQIGNYGIWIKDYEEG